MRNVIFLRLCAALCLVGSALCAQKPSAVKTNTPAAHPELLVQTGANSMTMIASMAISPDGHWYVCQQDDGLAIWSIDLRSQVNHISRPQHGMAALSVAADSRTILAMYLFEGIAADGTTGIARVDAITGQELPMIRIPGVVGAMAASPADMVFATLDGSVSKVEVRSLENNAVLFSDAAANVQNGPNGLRNVFFSADGSLVFLANADRVVGWDWRAKRRVVEFVAATSYSQNLDRTVAVNYSNGKTSSTARAENYNALQMVNLSADGTRLLACSKDELTEFDYQTRDKSFKKEPVRVAPAGKLYMGCGFFPGDRFYISLYSPVSVEMGSTLYSKDWKNETHLNGTIDKVLPVPKSALSLVTVVSQAPLLVRADGTVVNQTLPPPLMAVLPMFSADGQKLWWGEATRHPLFWDTDSGEATRQASLNVKNYIRSFSGDTKRMAFNDPDARALEETLIVADASSGKTLARYPLDWNYVPMEPSLDASGDMIAYLGKDSKLHVNHVGDADSVFTLDLQKAQLKQVLASLSPDGRELAVGLPEAVTVYAIPSGAKVASFAYDASFHINLHPQFSPDGAWLVIPRSLEPMRLISTKDWKTEKHLSVSAGGGGLGDTVSFSADGKLIAYSAEQSPTQEYNKPGDNFSAGGALVVDDIESGKHVYVADGTFSRCAISPNKQYLVAQAATGAQLVDLTTGKLLATLYVFSSGEIFDWLVITPDGLFDGSPAAWTRVNWRMSSESLEIAPAELFFREFYHPALLGELLAGKRPVATADIAKLDRRQPAVALHIDGNLDAVATRTVTVQVSVAESRAQNAGQKGGSGAEDLRLFRNGTLVKIWRGKLPLDAKGEATLTTEVPIVAGENRLTAYAFNAANIKSTDALLLVTGSDALKRNGTAYVLSIGINQYAADRAGQRLNLNYAQADAMDFSTQFVARQHALQNFQTIKVVQLANADATRANILAALGVLGGKPKDKLGEAQRTLLDAFDTVQPEDGVFIFYAGHGAARDGHFYLLPHDLDPQKEPNDAASHAISDQDLSVALEPISPTREFMVIDACQSGSALDTSGEVGPMNSTGLAQLAYEKGFYVLAASQGMEAALEASDLAGGHGYLTYALVEDGLRANAAAEDGVTELRPWFEYASHRVPELETKLKEKAPKAARGTTAEEDPHKHVWVSQHPRVFYRREPELTPFVVSHGDKAQAQPQVQ